MSARRFFATPEWPTPEKDNDQLSSKTKKSTLFKKRFSEKILSHLDLKSSPSENKGLILKNSIPERKSKKKSESFDDDPYNAAGSKNGTNHSSSRDFDHDAEYEHTPTKRVRKSKGFVSKFDSGTPVHSNSFIKQQIAQHRKFVVEAASSNNSGFRDHLPIESPFKKLSHKTTSTSDRSDENNVFVSPLSKSFGTHRTPQQQDLSDTNKRYSERFTSSTSSFQRKRKSYESSSMDWSPRGRSRSRSGQSFFESEFKSTNFIHQLDEERLDSARSVLETEVNSDRPFVDTHCHLDFLFKRLGFYESVDEYMEKTFFKFPGNFEGCIADWCQPSLYPRARTILNKGSNKFTLWGAIGCHPHFVADYSDEVEKQIEGYIDKYPQIIAWGEMGLDYSDRFGETDHELQKQVFVRQLDRARRRNLPLVIHCRDADPDLIKIMKQHVPHDTKIHRHCLTTEERDVRELLDYFPNCHVGFTNLLTNRSAHRPRDAVAKIPLERIVLETDAPYFIPRCVQSKSKGAAKWSHPGMASSVACEIAYIKETSVDEVLQVVRDNVSRLYGV